MNSQFDSYLYGTPIVNNKVFAVDIGGESVVDISLHDNGSIEVLSRVASPLNSFAGVFTVYKPSVPLETPNLNGCFSCEDFVERKQINRNDVQTISKFSKHYSEFMSMYSDCAHKGFSRCDQPQIRQFISRTGQEMNTYATYNKYRSTKLPYRDTYVATYHRGIRDFCNDIPTDIVQEYFDESLFMEYDQMKNNYNLNNITCSFIINDSVFLACSCGLNMSTLVVKELLINRTDDSYPMMHLPVTSKNMARYPLDFYIKEVTCLNGPKLFVRGDYHCITFSIVYKDGLMDIIINKDLHFNDVIECACVNPSDFTELIVCTKNRSVVIQGRSTPREIIDDESLEHVEWQRCIYGNFHETFILSMENDITLHDFRAPVSKSCRFLELPCQYLNRVEKLSPVLFWAPWNQHQLGCASDQSFILLDERFANTPLLKVNHYMKYPPRFSETLLLQNKGTLVSLGSYNDGEIVCFQVCNNNLGKPLVIQEPLWKLSPFNDWKLHVTDWRFSLNSVHSRIHQPLAGFTLSPLPSVEKDSKQFLVVNQSLPGDLFCQRFTFDEDSTDKKVSHKCVVVNELLSDNIDDKLLPLHKLHLEKCKQWISDVIKINNLNSENCGIYNKEFYALEKEGKLSMEVAKDRYTKEFVENKQDQCHVIELDMTDVGDRIVYYAESLECQMNQSADKKSENKQEERETKPDCLCRNCTHLRNLKIYEIKKSNSILTNKTLGRVSFSKSLKLVDDPKRFNGPISKCLAANWNEMEYIFLDMFDPTVAFDPTLNT